MDLFGFDSKQNILPNNGEVYYFGQIIDEQKAKELTSVLLRDIDWQHDALIIYGKQVTTKRMAAWYGDKSYNYTYSNATKTALPWIPELLEIKQWVEQKTKWHFNSCLLNLYQTGEEGMSWHSDDEKELGEQTTIASFSLGAERNFSFRDKQTKQKISLNLENGSLLVMKGLTQRYWQHSLPKVSHVSQPRINLTFRTIQNTHEDRYER